MKRTIELFAELGRRLRGIRPLDPVRQAPRVDPELACAANGWFTPRDIRRAVGAIVSRMLDPGLLAAWLSRYEGIPVGRPRRVLVVMAGNIPLVGFFDLLCVVASGHRCLVKPAAKDRVLMEYVCALLREIEPGVAIEEYDGRGEVDGVIATGSDNANRYFRSRFGGIPALLLGGRPLGPRARRTARGARRRHLGLFGPRLPQRLAALCPRGVQAASAGARRDESQIRQQLPPGAGAAGDGASPLRRCRRSTAGAPPRLPAHAQRAGRGRIPLDGGLQCVVSQCVDHSRRVDFGQAQLPTLTDYPDDRDILRFLTTELR